MSKLSPDFRLDVKNQRVEELKRQYDAKYMEWAAAITNGQKDLAERIDDEAEHLFEELRMINPSIKTTDFEERLKTEAEIETKQLHHKLNQNEKES